MKRPGKALSRIQQKLKAKRELAQRRIRKGVTRGKLALVVANDIPGR